jgi:hypothetical protein
MARIQHATPYLDVIKTLFLRVFKTGDLSSQNHPKPCKTLAKTLA